MPLRASTWLAEGMPPSKRLKRTIRRVVASTSETKRKDRGIDLNNPTTGVSYDITNIASGNNRDQRTGNRVKLTHLFLKLIARDCGTMRIILYCPKDPNNPIPDDTNFGPVDIADHWVVHDQFYNPGVRSTPGSSFAVNISKRLNMHTYFGSTAATDFMRNPLKLYIYTETGSGTQGAVSGFSRIFYKDL